jgi:hypothetical protein
VTHPPIIGLNGVARAGKDTVGGVLHDLYGYEIRSFSEALNNTLIALDPLVIIPWDVDIPGLHRAGHRPGYPLYVRYADLVDQVGYEAAKEVPEVRALLQRMGTEVGRNMFGADIWVEAMFKDYKPGDKWAVVNARFPNEFEAIWSRGGQVWEVTRDGYKPALGHLSDTAGDHLQKDAYIQNNGTIRDLADKVMILMDPVQAAFR